MTKRISAWWLGLLSAAFFASVGASHHRSSSYLEFAEFPGCSEVDSGRNSLPRFARRSIARIQERVTESSVPEVDAASVGHCYVGSSRLQPTEDGTPVSPLRKEQTNGDSHKNSNRITAYTPAFCPV